MVQREAQQIDNVLNKCIQMHQTMRIIKCINCANILDMFLDMLSHASLDAL